MSAWLKLLFVSVARLAAHEHRSTGTQPASFQLFERFQRLVEQHFREHWTVRDYVRELGVTEGRLSTVCRRTADQGALQIIHNRVIMEARRNLVYTNMSVSEVAYDLGFKDPAYFSRFFSQHAGEPPGRFKTRHKDGNPEEAGCNGFGSLTPREGCFLMSKNRLFSAGQRVSNYAGISTQADVSD